MMLGLGVGGGAVGMFHLITHAFFKALLFLGAGSVIHGCHEEQDIRKMGGLKKYMPITFATYAIGMMALSGVPIFFSGFWSKDAILHAAGEWNVSRAPYYLGVFGALLTAFYMTRQMCYVFFGKNREAADAHGSHHAPHESPPVMTIPLAILAVFAMALGFLGTPAWPWFQNYLKGTAVAGGIQELWEPEVLRVLVLSSIIVALGIGLGWWFYGRKPIQAAQKDILEKLRPDIFGLLQNKFYVDELYEATVVRFNAWWSGFCDAMDYWVWHGAVVVIGYVVVGLSWVNKYFDEYVVNLGFDEGCRGLNRGGRWLSLLQNGQVQGYLRVIGVAFATLGLLLLWGCHAS
jgi:NADH-quinone oxidoreductase subunit L